MASFNGLEISRGLYIKSSLASSNKTGWGKSAVDYLKESNERTNQDTYNYLLRTEGLERAEQFKKYNEENAI